MRIEHKVRVPREPKPVDIDPSYQAEVDRSTEKLERLFRQAQKSVEAAQNRLAKAQRLKVQRERRKAVQAAEDMLAERLLELAEYERMMTSTPASLAHRGRGAWRKVPR